MQQQGWEHRLAHIRAQIQGREHIYERFYVQFMIFFFFFFLSWNPTSLMVVMLVMIVGDVGGVGDGGDGGDGSGCGDVDSSLTQSPCWREGVRLWHPCGGGGGPRLSHVPDIALGHVHHVPDVTLGQYTSYTYCTPRT